MVLISIIEMGSNNLFSVVRALDHLGVKHSIVKSSRKIISSDKIILPGVGSFPDGMKYLKNNNLIEPILEANEKNVPILGICLGMQLMADYGLEFVKTKGLGLVKGKVIDLPYDHNNPNHKNLIPNIGWRSLKINKSNLLFDKINNNSMMYFIHSYYLKLMDNSNLIATIDVNGNYITAAFSKSNLFGVQFHPERSGDVGLTILKAFGNL